MLSALCTEQILSLIHPHEVKMQKRERKAQIEMADVMRKLAQSETTLVLTNREMRHLK